MRDYRRRRGHGPVILQVEIVAPTDATVLIPGETGTGKELIARAVHRIGPRRKAPFITLNCAAFPTGLLESDLFGHKRGAFTGGLSQKLGRFELANKGTLFLDEVGDIPLELQPQLLPPDRRCDQRHRPPSRHSANDFERHNEETGDLSFRSWTASQAAGALTIRIRSLGVRVESAFGAMASMQTHLLLQARSRT